MPNWCSTRFTFRGISEEVQLLHDRIVEWTSRSFTVTDFGDPWLGNILHGAGLTDRIDCSNEGSMILCRGTLNDITEVTEYKGNPGSSEFCVYTETAWVPMGKMWQVVIETLGLHSVQFAFVGEELGNEVYQKYDPHNLLLDEDEEWLLDMDVSDEPDLRERVSDDPNGVFYFSEDELRGMLQQLLGSDENRLDVLLEAAEDYPFSSDSSYIVAVHIKEINELRD